MLLVIYDVGLLLSLLSVIELTECCEITMTDFGLTAERGCTGGDGNREKTGKRCGSPHKLYCEKYPDWMSF